MRRLKEFELWFEKKKAGYSHAAYYTDKYEDGWIAALKWALTQETDLQHTELGGAIRRELKNDRVRRSKKEVLV